MNVGSAVVTIALADADLDRLACVLLERIGVDAAPESPWLDVDQAAEYLACSPKRIYDLVSEGRLRRAKEGRRNLFRREWLDAVIELDGGDNNEPEGGLDSDATGR